MVDDIYPPSWTATSPLVRPKFPTFLPPNSRALNRMGRKETMTQTNKSWIRRWKYESFPQQEVELRRNSRVVGGGGRPVWWTVFVCRPCKFEGRKTETWNFFFTTDVCLCWKGGGTTWSSAFAVAAATIPFNFAFQEFVMKRFANWLSCSS